MRRFIILLILILSTGCTVYGAEYAPPSVPPSAEKYFPDETESFGDGLWEIIVRAAESIHPEIFEAAKVCFGILAVIILVSLLRGASADIGSIIKLVSVISVAAILIKPSNSLLHLGIDTVNELSEYGKMLSPVLTGALAAQGGVSTATVLYAGTTVVNSVLSRCMSLIIVPVIYIYIALSVAGNAIGESMLGNLQSFAKWLVTWLLKTLIYIFTGYMSITGVVSGAADASTIKAAKLTFSSAVPVVGKIISDASDSVISGAAVIKNATGVYGLLAVIAMCVTPFLKVGIHYLLLKLTAALCGVFDNSPAVTLLKDFASAMGIVLAMVGTSGLLLMISIVCYIKGVS